MSTLREAAQQALEALEGFVRFAAIHSDGPDASDKYLAEDYAEEAFLKTAKVLPDLRAALAQQEEGRMEFNFEETVCAQCGSTNGAHSHDCPAAKAALKERNT
jgi:hypothetical protein